MSTSEENVEVSFTVREDVARALERIERHLEQLERRFAETGLPAQLGARQMAAGINDAEDAIDELNITARKTPPLIDDAGVSLTRTGRRAKTAAKPIRDTGRAARDAAKGFRIRSKIVRLVKWPLLITAIYALVGASPRSGRPR